MTCQWFSPGPQVSSTNKTDRHDITEKLLKVALSAINQTKPSCPLNLYWCLSFYLQAGANMIVSGSALMKSDNPGEVMQFMRNMVDDSIQKSQLER